MPDRYWIASSPGNWNDTANWGTVDGGSGGASVPGTSDNVFFTGTRLGACTVNVAVAIDGLSINGYTGTFDIAGFVVETVTGGNVYVGAGAVIVDTIGGGRFIVDGDFELDGAPGNEITWDGPDLELAGTGLVHHVIASDSDASFGAEVVATNSVNNGGNTNWDFGTQSKFYIFGPKL